MKSLLETAFYFLRASIRGIHTGANMRGQPGDYLPGESVNTKFTWNGENCEISLRKVH
jgi:hypothetical protein